LRYSTDIRQRYRFNLIHFSFPFIIFPEFVVITI